MAALPYIQLYVADYLADTMHLTTEEHGAYLLLIFNYWQTGKPIPKNRLARIARLSNDRWTDVEVSLNEFFNDNGTEWVHERVERDLDAVYQAQSQRSAAGKASAEARSQRKAAKEQRKSNDRSTPVEIPFNENATNKDTDTDTDTDKELKDFGHADKQPDVTPQKSKNITKSILVKEHGVDPQHAEDYLAVRKAKRSPFTETAFDQLKRQFAKGNLDVKTGIKICAQESWVGYDHTWRRKSADTGNKYSGFDRIDYEAQALAEGFNTELRI